MAETPYKGIAKHPHKGIMGLYGILVGQLLGFKRGHGSRKVGIDDNLIEAGPLTTEELEVSSTP